MVKISGDSSKWTLCAILAASLSATAVAQSAQQTSDRGTPVPSAGPELVQTASAELPDSPGTVQAQQNSSQSSQFPSQPVATPSNSQAAPPAASQEVKPQRPVGTAAAESPVVSGVTAAQPSGVAIAPAKQHRARTIMIRVGAIVGAGVAVGSVVALTAATSSKPPGAH